VLLTGRRYDVAGFIPVGVDEFFTVYLPDTPYRGLEGMALAAEEFGSSLEVDRGAALLLASASLWLEAGDSERAESLLGYLLSQPEIAEEVSAAIDGTNLGALAGG
jgi:hypothetical protein